MALSNTFLDTLYRAPSAPGLWGDVLDTCMTMVGADSGWVCELDRRDRFAGSGAVRNMEAEAQNRYFRHYAALDPFRHDAGGAPDPGLGLWSDERFIAKRDLVRSEFYADFMTPIRVHSILIVRMFDDGHVTRSMHLNYGRHGDWTAAPGWRDLKETFAHLKRAAALGREIGRLSARSAALGSAFKASSDCVFLLDSRGRICLATTAAVARLRRGDCLMSRKDKLTAVHAHDALELQHLLTQAVHGPGRCRTGGTMQVSIAKRNTPGIVTVVPLGLSDCGDGGPVAMVSLRDPEASITISDRMLTQRFGLTVAERRIALMLADGSSPRQIAEALAVTYNTVRNHMKKIYDKCDVRRQGELVAKLLGSSASAGE